LKVSVTSRARRARVRSVAETSAVRQSRTRTTTPLP
jgi:hypothetical protein